MKILSVVCAVCLGLASFGHAWTPARYKQGGRGKGKISYAISIVSGQPAFNASEESEIVADLTARGLPVVVVSTAATNVEVNVSTCVLQLNSLDDYYEALTRRGIEEYAEALWLKLQFLNDAGGQAGRRADLQQRYEYLRHAQRNVLP